MKRILLLVALISSTSLAKTRKEVRKEVKNNTFLVMSPEDGSSGSSFSVIDSNGKVRIVTNAHVCNSAKTMYAEDIGILPVVKIDQKNDLCELEAPVTITHGLKIGKQPEPGDAVYTAGYPYNYNQNFTMQDGEIVALFQNKSCDMLDPKNPKKCSTVDSFLTTALSGSGGSGGPAVNDNGEVIGVVFSVFATHISRQGAVGHAAIIRGSVLKNFLNN